MAVHMITNGRHKGGDEPDDTTALQIARELIDPTHPANIENLLVSFI
jgi:hypothetical protein